MKETGSKKYYTPGEVAELLMISPVTVRQLSQKGELDSVMTPGGHRRYLYRHIEAFARNRNISLEVSSTSGARILVVDNNPQYAGFICDSLAEHQGVDDIQVANSGFRAGTLLYSFEPHVVLLDLGMPYVDGFSVCRDIKSGETTKYTRVIAMSGFYSQDNLKYIIEAGAECCLEKPFGPEELYRAVGLETPAKRQVYQDMPN